MTNALFDRFSRVVELKVATRPLLERYMKSFGAVNALFSYLDEYEQTNLQLCNQWMYHVAVQRSQSAIRVRGDISEIYFYN